VTSTRRGFLHSAGLAGLGAGTLGVRAARAPARASKPAPAVSFHGAHQAGIATPAQNFLQLASVDMVSDSLADLRNLMSAWTSAAVLMAAGQPIGSPSTGPRPAVDTGEALGLSAAGLTVTFGFGPSLFNKDGTDRFGLAGQRPAPLVDLPSFRHDALQASISGGDLVIQACCDDPQVAFHAVHELIRMAHPVARPRWLLAGAGRTGNSTVQVMPRNLMGFFDGTANVMVEDGSALDEFVWAAGPASPDWMAGGSYLVARRIQIALGRWDAASVTDQQQTIGRTKVTGNVLDRLPEHAHIRLASPGRNGGERILRRGYTYVDGLEAGYGAPATGLMFLCYQRDPRSQFIPIQRRLSEGDALNTFTTHIGSAIFACPPGAPAGGYVGQTLLH